MQISNCEIKPSRYGAGFEIMLKKSSVIAESSHHEEIDVSRIISENEADIPHCQDIVLSELQGLLQHTKVTVSKVKVIERNKGSNATHS